MSKEIYVVNCYTCQHNGQETCKGCNTLLNGDVEPYENWELREDLSQKDQRIAELEQDLEFTTKTANELIEIKHKLEQELAELKEKAIVVPVKLGDTIYVVPSETNYRLNIVNRREDRNKVYKYLVDEIRYNKYGFSIVSYIDSVPFYFNEKIPKNLCGHFDTEKYYGETWFTTEQEAQAKLKEMKGNE